MEQQGLEPKDLATVIGTRTRVSEGLNQRRNLSIPQMTGCAPHLDGCPVVPIGGALSGQ